MSFFGGEGKELNFLSSIVQLFILKRIYEFFWKNTPIENVWSWVMSLPYRGEQTAICTKKSVLYYYYQGLIQKKFGITAARSQNYIS